jgi:hypothetical protein
MMANDLVQRTSEFSHDQIELIKRRQAMNDYHVIGHEIELWCDTLDEARRQAEAITARADNRHSVGIYHQGTMVDFRLPPTPEQQPPAESAKETRQPAYNAYGGYSENMGNGGFSSQGRPVNSTGQRFLD